MAEAIYTPSMARVVVAVVTGANRGLGFEICRQLAARGVVVVLTSRDERKGCEAVEKLKGGLPSSSHQLVVFHQLDVTSQASVASLVDFVRGKFRKLDILMVWRLWVTATVSDFHQKRCKDIDRSSTLLFAFDDMKITCSVIDDLGLFWLSSIVNNAGTIGVVGDVSAVKDYLMRNASRVESASHSQEQLEAVENVHETYELAEQCFQTDYFGSKRMVEAFLPLLKLSNSPRIVNMSTVWGLLKCVENEWVIDVLSDSESLTEEKVDEVVKVFLKDYKEGALKAKKWPTYFPTYAVAKAALNAYTRVLAKKYPTFYINSVDPGHTQTDMSCHTGPLTAEQGADTVVKVALLPHGGPSGVFIVYEKVPSSVDNYPIMTLPLRVASSRGGLVNFCNRKKARL